MERIPLGLMQEVHGEARAAAQRQIEAAEAVMRSADLTASTDGQRFFFMEETVRGLPDAAGEAPDEMQMARSIFASPLLLRRPDGSAMTSEEHASAMDGFAAKITAVESGEHLGSHELTAVKQLEPGDEAWQLEMAFAGLSEEEMAAPEQPTNGVARNPPVAMVVASITRTNTGDLMPTTTVDVCYMRAGPNRAFFQARRIQSNPNTGAVSVADAVAAEGDVYAPEKAQGQTLGAKDRFTDPFHHELATEAQGVFAPPTPLDRPLDDAAWHHLLTAPIDPADLLI